MLLTRKGKNRKRSKSKIKELENMIFNYPSEDEQNILRELKYELSEFTNKKTKFLIQGLRHKNIEYTNKSGKHMANLIK